MLRVYSFAYRDLLAFLKEGLLESWLDLLGDEGRFLLDVRVDYLALLVGVAQEGVL